MKNHVIRIDEESYKRLKAAKEKTGIPLTVIIKKLATEKRIQEALNVKSR